MTLFKGEGGTISTHELPQTPKALVYAQMDRVLIARAKGQGAMETLKGLTSMLGEWKDAEWYADMRAIAEKDSPLQDELVWSIVEATVRLLARHGLWPRSPEPIESGTELAQAV